MSGQPSECGDSMPGGCGPPEGGAGSGWVWSRKPVWALTRYPVWFSHADGPTLIKRHQWTPLPLCQNHPLRSLKVLILSPSFLCWGHTGTGGPSLAIPQALEVAIPADMTPLCLNVGDVKRVYQCWIGGCSEGLSTSHMTICTHVHWAHLGVKLVCPAHGLSLIWMPSGNTKSSYFGVSQPTLINILVIISTIVLLG